MSKPKNPPIGEVECIAKGCTERARVFRFRERGSSDASVRNRRFAGRVYAVCPEHGRFGGDLADKRTQDYILEKATIWNPEQAEKNRDARPAAAPSSQPMKAEVPAMPPTPAPTPPRRPPAPKPAQRPPTHAPTTPARDPRPDPTSEPSRGWGYFA